MRTKLYNIQRENPRAKWLESKLENTEQDLKAERRRAKYAVGTVVFSSGFISFTDYLSLQDTKIAQAYSSKGNPL